MGASPKGPWKELVQETGAVGVGLDGLGLWGALKAWGEFEGHLLTGICRHWDVLRRGIRG